jgi:hypothetical protein
MSKKQSTFSKVPYREFRSMANVLKSDLWKEVQRRHRERGENCGPDHAIEIAKNLIKQSSDSIKWLKHLRNSENPSQELIKETEQQIWVICAGAYVRGYHTKAKGSVAASHKDSYRAKLGHITARTRPEFLREIMRIIGCDHNKAVSILETGRKNGFFVCLDRRSGIWHSGDAVEIHPRRSRTLPILTPKQKEHWEIFGPMPELAYVLENGRLRPDCEAAAWTVARAKQVTDRNITPNEAILMIDRARKCSISVDRAGKRSARVELIPFTAKAGKMFGKQTYLLGSLRGMPELREREAREFVLSIYPPGTDINSVIEGGEACGEVAVFEPEDLDEEIIFTGVDVAEVKRKASQAESERKEAEEKKRLAEQAEREFKLKELQANGVDDRVWLAEINNEHTYLAKHVERRWPHDKDLPELANWIHATFELPVTQLGGLIKMKDNDQAWRIMHNLIGTETENASG